MELLERLLICIAVVASLCLLVGLYKPWVVLWWEDHQNRKKVIKLYGAAVAVSYFLYWIILFIKVQ